MSTYAAVKQFGVPRSTLRDRLSGRVAVNAKPGRKPKLNVQLEEKLIDYASNRAKLGIGFRKTQFLKYASMLAEKYKKKFTREKKLATGKWWRLMNKWHNGLSLQQPEGTVAVHHQCIDPVKIGNYFAALKGIVEVKSAEREWNMNETGLQLDEKAKKVVASKGTKYLHSRTSGNRKIITVIACINAARKCIPPHCIVKGKTERSLMGFTMNVAPRGTLWSVSETGWTKQGLAQLWFLNTFLPNIGPERLNDVCCQFF